MVEIDPNALVYLVQLVDEKLQRIKEEVSRRDAEDEELLDYEEELVVCSKVAMELERCYHQAEKIVGNIPTYAELTR